MKQKTINTIIGLVLLGLVFPPVMPIVGFIGIAWWITGCKE